MIDFVLRIEQEVYRLSMEAASKKNFNGSKLLNAQAYARSVRDRKPGMKVKKGKYDYL